VETFYVWSGSLRGERTEASDAQAAVELAVRKNLPCVLGASIRVSYQARGLHPLDVYFQYRDTPYKTLFPGLFDGSLDVEVSFVESL
jgi:hypothetical protein